MSRNLKKKQTNQEQYVLNPVQLLKKSTPLWGERHINLYS